ncbi:hypothetical protein JL720_989 [Aureococcus anophagefferens]|nr:hypothetical protein JL720_989 [Aureococcus anophagefferens]
MNYQRNTGAALEDMFSPRPPNVTAGDNPVLPKHRVPFYAGGLANTMNAGFAVNVAVTADLLGVGGNFSAASINLASYAPTEDYVFVEDPLGSTTDGPVFFRDHFDSSLTAYPQLAPANGGQTPSLWGPNSYNASELGLSARWVASVGIPYDPCDEDGDPKFMGLPKACFHLHQASPHTTNGQNFPFYKPLKDGTLDFFGVCDATEDAAALCEAHRAGLCNATNAHPLVTGSNETRYEYPVDVPMRWSPYPAVPIPDPWPPATDMPTAKPTPAPTAKPTAKPTPEPTPAPVATARKPKVRGCGRAALAEEVQQEQAVQGKDPKYDAKGNRVIKCRTRRTSRDKRDKHDAGR